MFFHLSFFAAEPFLPFFSAAWNLVYFECWSLAIPAKRIQLALSSTSIEGAKVHDFLMQQAMEASIGSQSGHHWINDTSASRGRPHLFCALSKFPISFVKSKILEFLCKDFLPLPTFTIETQRLQRFHSNCCSWWLSTHHPMSKNYVLNLGAVGCLLSCVDVGISKFASPPPPAFIHFS